MLYTVNEFAAIRNINYYRMLEEVRKAKLVASGKRGRDRFFHEDDLKRCLYGVETRKLSTLTREFKISGKDLVPLLKANNVDILEGDRISRRDFYITRLKLEDLGYRSTRTNMETRQHFTAMEAAEVIGCTRQTIFDTLRKVGMPCDWKPGPRPAILSRQQYEAVLHHFATAPRSLRSVTQMYTVTLSELKRICQSAEIEILGKHMVTYENFKVIVAILENDEVRKRKYCYVPMRKRHP